MWSEILKMKPVEMHDALVHFHTRHPEYEWLDKHMRDAN